MGDSRQYLEQVYPDRKDGNMMPFHEIEIHKKRYEWAKDYCEGKSVLDAGCGSGYGSKILSAVAKKVVGVDSCEEAIEYAKGRYQNPNIEFVHEDIMCIGNDEKFDVITCFEFIEHVNDPKGFIDMANGLLNEGGLILLSVPMFDEPGRNKYHKTCFILDDIYGLFDLKRFRIDLLFQHFDTAKVLEYPPGRFFSVSNYVIRATKGEPTTGIFKWSSPYKMKISVVVPMYNEEKFIDATMFSLVSQMRIPDEIIVVDDASTDNSANRVKDFIKKYPKFNIKLVRHKKNGGISETRNTGVANATGDYIAFLSSDDCWEPDFLTVMEATAINNPQFKDKIMYSSYNFIDENGMYRESYDIPNLPDDPEDFKVRIVSNLESANMFTNFSTVFAPARYFRELPFKYRFGEDGYWLLASSIIKKWEWKGIPIYLCRYRIHENRTTDIKLGEIIDNNYAIIKEVMEAAKHESTAG